jgi:toxin-antitoxin system PIN domain toxin
LLLDANLLLYAVDARSVLHKPAAVWLEETLNGERAVALPWQTLGAFVRISTHPRVSEHPLTAEAAWAYVESWLAADPVWVPAAGERTAAILGRLIRRHEVTGNLVTDAQLAALAIEHGLVVYTVDSDFARFDEVSWHNPLR